MLKYSMPLLASLLLFACQSPTLTYDASGTFEAEEVIISAESNGKILALDIEEGKELQAGEIIGHIDSIQLVLQKKQVEASISAILSRRPDIASQLAGIETQIETAKQEKTRVEKLLAAEAATPKQLDDLNAQIRVLEKQLSAHARAHEMTGAGKPIYKIADITTLNLRTYISGTQLPKVALGQKVRVLVDNGEEGYKDYEGTISWISSQAEFTPKTIQTQEERSNLVYAVKIRVPNDGYLKIGMYAEVDL